MTTNASSEIMADVNKSSYNLQGNSELRFDAGAKDVFVELISGSAEIFGCQLPSEIKYKIMPNSKLSVFTWHGCTLNVYGKVENLYTSENSAMVTYINVHFGLNEMRKKAQKENARGPRILVAGPPGIGKSTLCKILTNYSIREDWCPILVDINPANNDISLPGTLACLPMYEPMDIEGDLMLDNSLVYHYGHMSSEINVKLYDLIVQKLTSDINARSEMNEKCKASGVIINTCGYTQKEGYQCLLNAIKSFEADVVVVLEHELLYQNLQRDVPNGSKILCLPKPGGVFGMSEKKDDWKSAIVRNYFYGVQNNIFPHVFDMKFDDIQVYKTVASKGKDPLLPLHMQEMFDNVVPVQISNSLKYQVLSISGTVPRNNDDLVRSNIFGFVVVNKVDMQKKTVTLLSPQPRQEFRYNVLLLIDGLTFQDA